MLFSVFLTFPIKQKEMPLFVRFVSQNQVKPAIRLYFVTNVIFLSINIVLGFRRFLLALGTAKFVKNMDQRLKSSADTVP